MVQGIIVSKLTVSLNLLGPISRYLSFMAVSLRVMVSRLMISGRPPAFMSPPESGIMSDILWSDPQVNKGLSAVFCSCLAFISIVFLSFIKSRSRGVALPREGLDSRLDRM